MMTIKFIWKRDGLETACEFNNVVEISKIEKYDELDGVYCMTFKKHYYGDKRNTTLKYHFTDFIITFEQ